MQKEKIKIRRNRGQAMLISTIFFLFLSLAIIAGLVSPSIREFKISNDLMKSRQSFFLSESVIEDSYFRLKVGKAIGSTNTITLGDDSATATITDSGYNEKTVSSTGDVSLRQRKNEIVLSPGTGASFSYGVQVGLGGITMENNSKINGSVYSNGLITGSGTPSAGVITGAAISATTETVNGLIDGVRVGTNGVGNAKANTINNTTIAGTKYCQSTNNSPACNTTLPDPVPIAMPISDQNILDWKAEAEAGGVHDGDYIISSGSPTLGPIKITGDLSISQANVTVTGNIWVQKNVKIENNVNVNLSPSYGASEGVLVTDGTVDIKNNAIFSGSGTEGSYLMVLSTSTSSLAITLGNNAGAVILYAGNGTVNLANNAGASSLNGKSIYLNNGATITYDSGLINSNFVNGPSGGWSITSWKEIK